MRPFFSYLHCNITAFHSFLPVFLYPICSKSVNPVNACRKIVDDVYVGLRQFTPMNTFGEINTNTE